jgi:diacylglycerol kinase (ATP)
MEVTEIKKNTGIMRVLRAFCYSVEGIIAALRHEAAFRQEMCVSILMIPIAIWFPFPLILKLLLISSLFFVMVVELLNSGLEWVVDYISLERHPLAKRAKDMASAAVFLSIFNSVILWLISIFFYWNEIRLLFK